MVKYDRMGRLTNADGTSLDPKEGAFIDAQAGVVPGTDEFTRRRVIDDYKSGTGLHSPYAGLNPDNPHGGALPYEERPLFEGFSEWFSERVDSAVKFVPRVFGSMPARGRNKPMTAPERAWALLLLPFVMAMTTIKAVLYAPAAAVSFSVSLCLALLEGGWLLLTGALKRLAKPLAWIVVALVVCAFAAEFILDAGVVEWIRANTSLETERMLDEKLRSLQNLVGG